MLFIIKNLCTNIICNTCAAQDKLTFLGVTSSTYPKQTFLADTCSLFLQEQQHTSTTFSAHPPSPSVSSTCIIIYKAHIVCARKEKVMKLYISSSTCWQCEQFFMYIQILMPVHMYRCAHNYLWFSQITFSHRLKQTLRGKKKSYHLY